MERWTGWPQPPQNAQPERRTSQRFHLSLELRYIALSRQMSEEKGSGRTIDISSSGLKFSSEGPILIGQRVEVFIDWPAVLNGNIKLQLVMSGIVVRTNGTEVAVEIQRHQFKTRSLGASR